MDRRVDVARERLSGWVDTFVARHGGVEVTATDLHVRLLAPDGARAEIEVPFPPLPVAGEPLGALFDHVRRDRRVGLVLVRRSAHAVGVAEGARLLRSKVGTSYVQGRTKAGGWSQQRFARRRDNQAHKAYADAADTVARLLLPAADGLTAVVCGGDRTAVTAVFGDPRLAALAPLVVGPVHSVPDPRLRVLEVFATTYLAVPITLNELA